jgi:hypothetical protein
VRQAFLSSENDTETGSNVNYLVAKLHMSLIASPPSLLPPLHTQPRPHPIPYSFFLLLSFCSLLPLFPCTIQAKTSMLTSGFGSAIPALQSHPHPCKTLLVIGKHKIFNGDLDVSIKEFLL